MNQMLVLFFGLLAAVVVVSGSVSSIKMKVVNAAGAPIELYWINTFDKHLKNKLVKQTTRPIRNNSDTSIDSYNTHQFLVRFLAHKNGVEKSFTKGPREEVVTIYYNASSGFNIRQVTKYDEISETIKSAAAGCGDLAGDAYTNCVTNSIVDDMVRIADSKETMTKFRNSLARRLRNYTCADEELETTEPISRERYRTSDGQTVLANVLFDTPNAKIWYVDDFIKEEECAVLKKHGLPRLRRATVAGEDGTSIVSENRKAQQASYDMHREQERDPLWSLFNRVLSLTNQHAGYNLQPEGQEHFTIIQYNPDDQYTPHCDGSCDGEPHISAGRVATAVLYCEVPTRGGATTFTRSDIFVKPRPGMATFFSYLGEDGNMDEGFTEHSGCPVIEGNKWITTLWMRLGVSDQEPWTLFDPSGVRLLNEEGDESSPQEQEDVDNDVAGKDEL